MHGVSAIEQDLRQRNIVVDNAYRPGKGSKPRPIANYDELSRKMDVIFGWSKRKRQQRKQKGAK